MNRPDREKKDMVVAAAVTLAAALIILVLLFTLSLNYDRNALAEMSTPELIDDEEVYLEPELLQMGDPGATDEAEEVAEEAPQAPGMPDEGEEQTVRVVKNEVPPKEEPKRQNPKMVADTRESDVKTSTPKLNSADEKRISGMKGMKSDNNGSLTGKESAHSGSGGTGVSASPGVRGRRMLSCPTWKLKLDNKTVVKVSVTVDAAGNVSSATAVSGGSSNLQKQCEKMAKGSKWTPKEGAKPENGYITFTITP